MSWQASRLLTVTTYLTLLRNRNLYVKLEEICGHHVFNVCKTLLLLFFFLLKVLPLDLWTGPLSSGMLHVAEVPLSAFWVSLNGSTRGALRGE